MAVENQLSTLKREKNYFGVPELQLLFSGLSKQMDVQDGLVEAKLRRVGPDTRARPGSLAVIDSKDIRVDQQQCLRWQDIEFIPNLDGGGLAVRVRINWIKGRRDPYDERVSQRRGITYLIKSCRQASNLPADCPWLLLVLGFERGLFAAATIDELLESALSKLTLKPEIAQPPVFVTGHKTQSELVKDKPLRSVVLNRPLQKACQEAGIAAYASMYSWRREFISYTGCSSTVAEAKELATRASLGNASY